MEHFLDRMEREGYWRERHGIDQLERVGHSHPWVFAVELGGRATACLNLEHDYARGVVSTDLPSLWRWYETRKGTR